MSDKTKIAKKTGPGKDVQNVIRTFTLEMRMVSKVPKSYYSRVGGVAAR